MRPHVTCYPQPAKPKALALAAAFAAGVAACGGRADVCTSVPKQLAPGAAAFYGVRPGWAPLWEQAKREGRDWYYLDNAYFDCARERYFRVSRNVLQVDGLCATWGDGRERLQALGVEIRDWRTGGGHIVICPQSAEFMRVVAGYAGDWLSDVTASLRQYTSRPFRIRRKGEPRPLAEDLRGAWALVTHMSCAAVESLLAGIPVICTGRCSARWMGCGALDRIETPYLPPRRERWAAVLAANQWTEDEIRHGAAWKAWNAA